MSVLITIDGAAVQAQMDSVKVSWGRDGRNSTAEFRLKVNPLVGIYDEALYDEAVYDDRPLATYDEAAYDEAIYDAVAGLPNQQSLVVIEHVESGRKFRGIVVGVARENLSPTFQWWTVSCIGFEYRLANVVISRTWTAMTDREILQDAFGDILPTITTADATVSELTDPLTITAKDWTLKKLVETLAGLSGAEWFIDGDGALIYRAAGSVAADFEIQNPPGSGKYPCRKLRPERQSIAFFNKVTILGGYFGTAGAELRATEQNDASIAELATIYGDDGIIEAVYARRDLKTQAAVDLAAEIELERAGGVTEIVQLTLDSTKLPADDAPEICDMLQIDSNGAGIHGAYSIQSLTMTLVRSDWVRWDIKAGDYNGSLEERLRRLQELKEEAEPPATPPPPNSVGNSHIPNGELNWSKMNAATVTISGSQVDSIDFTQVENVLIEDSMVNEVNILKLIGSFTAGTVNLLFDDDSISGAKIASLSVDKLTAGAGGVTIEAGGDLTLVGGDILLSPGGGLVTVTLSTSGMVLPGTLQTTTVDASVSVITGHLYSVTGLNVGILGGVQVVGAQQSAIANAAGGDEVTKINAILGALRAHGLIAT